MARFNVPAQTKLSIMTIDSFLGVDFTNFPTNVDDSRSPNAPNMIRSVPGKVRKHRGYEKIDEYAARINGVFYLRGSELPLIHAGTKIYKDHVVLYDDANDERSKAWQVVNKLYIIDGKTMLVYDGVTVVAVSSVATTPIVQIGKTPTGGADGMQLNPLNLLQSKYTEKFLGTATDKQYHLTHAPLDATLVVAEVLNSSGVWVAKTEGVDFSVNRSTAVVSFNTAPGVSPITSEDNVTITASRAGAEEYASRINKCDIGALFGVNGAPDRLFLSGNPDYSNWDWYSEKDDFTNFPDLGYSVLGGSGSEIMGYSIVNDRLATHKDQQDTERNVIIREGNLVDNRPSFPIVNSLQGVGAISKHSFCYLATEPLFLTALGVYAITPQDITGEKYAQNRSFYLNGRLLDETKLENAYAFVYRDFYYLCVNDVAYILDGLQPFAPERSMPYSTRQYAGFYRTSLPARVMWTRDDVLYFGSSDGKLYQFYSDTESQASYNDDGEAILARWETPDIDGNLFYKNKTFRFLAARLASAQATGVRILGYKRGFWSVLKEDFTKARFLDFGQIIFSKFTFSSDPTPRLISSKVRIKKQDKVRFAFENGELNEPFGLFDIAFEFREGGNAK